MIIYISYSISAGILFSIIALVASLMGLIVTISTTRLLYKSEKDLYVLIRQNKIQLEKEIINLQKLKLKSKQEIVQRQEFREIDEILKTISRKLDKNQQKQIYIGLNQTVPESKVDYIDKLLINSGSTINHIYSK